MRALRHPARTRGAQLRDVSRRHCALLSPHDFPGHGLHIFQGVFFQVHQGCRNGDRQRPPRGAGRKDSKSRAQPQERCRVASTVRCHDARSLAAASCQETQARQARHHPALRQISEPQGLHVVSFLLPQRPQVPGMAGRSSSRTERDGIAHEGDHRQRQVRACTLPDIRLRGASPPGSGCVEGGEIDKDNALPSGPAFKDSGGAYMRRPQRQESHCRGGTARPLRRIEQHIIFQADAGCRRERGVRTGRSEDPFQDNRHHPQERNRYLRDRDRKFS